MKFKIQNSKFKIKDNFKIKTLIEILLENRGIKTKREIGEFLNPKLENVTIEGVGIDKEQLKKAVLRIKKAIKNKEEIVVFGDYDVDGICGTAILWETLRLAGLAQGKPYENVFPYIPHRIEEGYGLSIRGIENIKNQSFGKLRTNLKDVKLIITVDNGIVANKAVDFANKQGIDVIITDHHVPSNPSTGSGLPNALAVVHTTKLCGTGVAYMFSNVILNEVKNLNQKRDPSATPQDDILQNHLELVALATVADLVPLKGTNRTLLKFGLEALRKTKRMGLLELFKEAGINQSKIGVYEIGHMIAPRLNATGRLDYAMDSLRLICTTSSKRAEKLAKEIGLTNKERQLLTIQTTEHAITKLKTQNSKLKNLLFISHESYQQGVIGLVAGKLVEEFYRPAIVISIGKKFSKASARSIKGFNIIEFIRTASEFLVDAGGHPMAAGFTIETEKIPILEKFINSKIGKLIDEQSLVRKLNIDCEIPLSFIDLNLYESLQKLAPFGMGNPEPTFISRNVIVDDMRSVGMENKHIKFYLGEETSRVRLGAIAFNMGDRISEFRIGDKINVAYTIEKDDWNGNERLQLEIKDIQ